MVEFYAQERVRVELGPRRLALAVDDGDVEQLTLAMRAASSMWGGRRYPILAIPADGQLSAGAQQLLDVLETTSIIDFTGKLASSGPITSGGRVLPVSAARPLDDGWQWTPPAIVSFTWRRWRAWSWSSQHQRTRSGWPGSGV